MPSTKAAPLRKYVVPVTVMLSFVSFWRASAIVLCDLGSSAYYVGGIAEQAIGKSAPWFILAIMLFSYAVRAIYIESCSMFVRGGVYRVVREAMGATAAKFSVAALMFDYVLTGPISGVSAGLYFAALLNEIGQHFRLGWMHVPAPWFAAAFAALVTMYFWYTNLIGVPFSSTRALRIMQATTVMVVMLILWSVFTLVTQGYHAVPAPTPANYHFNDSSLGWLKGTVLPSFTVIAVLIGLGHSVLALSGEETLAQVNREIAAPKQKNLEKAGFIIFVYSLLFTSLVSFFAVMIIPDDQRARYLDNLIGGLSMFLAGPYVLRLAFHCFVVLIGVFMLAGAVNTAIIGSNGVLSRVAEDGVLPPWFREPHAKHGTTHRIIGLIVGLQLLTIALSHGDVNMLGEAYAFGVVWSFAMKGLAVVVLRFSHPDAPRWRFPLNIRLGKRELPIGLVSTTAILFAMAMINLFTKKVATVTGVIFTIIFFALFTWSERKYALQQKSSEIGGNPHPDDPFQERSRERFRLEEGGSLSPASLGIGASCVIAGVEKAADLRAVDHVLEGDLAACQDVVVVCAHPGLKTDEEQSVSSEKLVGDRETDIFSVVVFAAEKQGKPVKLLALPGEDSLAAYLYAAVELKATQLFFSSSAAELAEEDKSRLQALWERTSDRATSLEVTILGPADASSRRFCLEPARRN